MNNTKVGEIIFASDAVDEVSRLCVEIKHEFPRAIFLRQ